MNEWFNKYTDIATGTGTAIGINATDSEVSYVMLYERSSFERTSQAHTHSLYMSMSPCPYDNKMSEI